MRHGRAEPGRVRTVNDTKPPDSSGSDPGIPESRDRAVAADAAGLPPARGRRKPAVRHVPAPQPMGAPPFCFGTAVRLLKGQRHLPSIPPPPPTGGDSVGPGAPAWVGTGRGTAAPATSAVLVLRTGLALGYWSCTGLALGLLVLYWSCTGYTVLAYWC